MSSRFVRIAHLSDLAPGKMMRVDVENLRIVLVNAAGKVCALDDTCSHEDASLATGSLQGEFVKCPLHGSRFHVCTGAVLDEPAAENLQTYPVQVDGDDILVRL